MNFNYLWFRLPVWKEDSVCGLYAQETSIEVKGKAFNDKLRIKPKTKHG